MNNEQIAMIESLRRQASGPSVIPDSPVVRTVNDIRMVLSILDPVRTLQSSVSMVNAELDGQATHQSFNVSAQVTDCNPRTVIVGALEAMAERQSALEKVKSRDVEPLVINNRVMNPVSPQYSGKHSVDDVIARHLGAYRDGLLICWDIEGYTYRYDIFEHKLTRIEIDQ